LPKRPLGRTREKLSIIGLGGLVLANETQEAADALVREAVDHGINYFDVAPSYGNAEDRLGPALRPFRKDIFLACKTLKRDKMGAAEELERSLRKLETDYFDLYQLHALAKTEEVEQALGPNGAPRNEWPKCWYQPSLDPGEAELAMRFTLSQPVTAAVPPGDKRLFRKALDLAHRFSPLQAEDEARVRQVAWGHNTHFRINPQKRHDHIPS
jgi:hypothetical protein